MPADPILDNTPNPDAPPRLALRPTECAKALGISERKLWEITADKSSGIPHLSFGRSIRYPVQELRIWLGEQALKRLKEGGQ